MTLRRDMLSILVMTVAILLVFWSPRPVDRDDFAYDYNALHKRRMEYARESLLGPRHTVPAWYTRELMGTPFWSNISNFPFIPNRLLVLLTTNPYGRYAWTVAVNLSAILAALFTFLFCRMIGLGSVASATAGWTFACCGYFMIDVGGGQLAKAESHCALPLLLWAVESFVQAQQARRSIARWIVVAFIGAAYVILQGHPQIPIYALASASVYAIWRTRKGIGWKPVAAMALAAPAAAFAWLPMLMLIRRSTRLFAQDPATNDLAMPYRRLLGFFLPWLDGAPDPLPLSAKLPFHGYPNLAYFWDTFCYAGLAPWVAAAILLVWQIRKGTNLARSPAKFITWLGVAGILLSLPFVKAITSELPGVWLRSPARIIYLTDFALAVALGGAVQLAIAGALGRWGRWALPVALLLHGYDLYVTARQFQPHLARDPRQNDPIVAGYLANVGDQRIGMGTSLDLDVNRRFDDIGFYDSIMLAKSYRFVIDLGIAPPKLNRENLEGLQLPTRLLEAAGVKYVFTEVDAFTKLGRKDWKLLDSVHSLNIYEMPSPQPRAGFFPADRIAYLETEKIHGVLRNPTFDPHPGLLIPQEYKQQFAQSSATTQPAQVAYRRPDSDHIECTVSNAQPGYLRVIETWDAGWSATVDGRPAAVVPAMDALLAVPLEPGNHDVRLVFETPGWLAGIVVSLVGVVVLLAWTVYELKNSHAAH